MPGTRAFTGHRSFGLTGGTAGVASPLANLKAIDTLPEFRGFDFVPTQPIMGQFLRMCLILGCVQNGELWRRASSHFMDLLVLQFNFYYGVDAESPDPWVENCRIIGVHPFPNTFNDARTAVLRAHFTVIDLIEHKWIGTNVPVFDEVDQLKRYELFSNKTFPVYHVEAGTLLRYLMDHRLNPKSHIDKFFLEPPRNQFPYDPSEQIMIQFFTMGAYFNWSEVEKRVYRHSLRHTLVIQFNDDFGVDVNSHESWKRLCSSIGIQPIPVTMIECRIAVQAGTYVNVVDLLENQRNNTKVMTFETIEEPSDYTQKSDKIFPREDRSAGGALISCFDIL